ncbi:lipid A deacylase LpxR family protein [Marinobacter hydrocarbonoclasticus]|nr:lipid A deacylase LpxR family protein [Marinobacter nauticus]
MKRVLPLALLCTTPTTLASTGYWMMDNDVVVKTDGDYTNGLFLGHISRPGDGIPSLLQPFARTFPEEQAYWHGEISQLMWTPSDLNPDEQESLERPYAGVLLTTFGLGLESPGHNDQYAVSVGVIGPASGAEAVQRQVHKWLGNTAPDGWENQIENTPLMQLSWTRNQRLWSSDAASTGWDLLWHPRAQGGNIRSEAALGVSLSFGDDLSILRGRHWQQPFVSGPARTGWALFAGTELRYRLNDITLQGPRPDAAPDVSVAHWQGGWATGIRGHYGNIGASFSIHGDSPDYKNAEQSWAHYGRLAINWRY